MPECRKHMQADHSVEHIADDLVQFLERLSSSVAHDQQRRDLPAKQRNDQRIAFGPSDSPIKGCTTMNSNSARCTVRARTLSIKLDCKRGASCAHNLAINRGTTISSTPSPARTCQFIPAELWPSAESALM